MSERFDLAVRGGTLVRPGGRAELDVYVRDGKIAATAPRDRPLPAREELDAAGRFVLPGGVDTHVHFMDPGDASREDFPTGSAAAAARGVTTVVEHTHGWPVTDAARLAEKVEHLEGRSHVDYGLAAHVWPDKIDGLAEIWSGGATYFKAFTCETHGVPAIEAGAMLELAERLVELNATCLVHCEDDHLTASAERRLREEHRSDGGIVPAWRSREAELVSVAMVAAVARRSGARMAVAHASSAEVLDLIERERAAGADLFAESCPQYLHLREDEVLREGAFRKFTPPARIRSEGDERRMWDRFESGSIHHISSDHAPATRAQKRDGDIWSVHFGLPGVDTTFPIMTHAALAGRTSLERVVEAYCELPARLYGIRGKGRIEVGYDADMALLDPEDSWRVSDEDVISKAGWSPYSGRELRGRFTATVLRGEVIARGAAPSGDSRRGRFLPGAGA
jgi:dihydroorotase (multifunctional complex type)